MTLEELWKLFPIILEEYNPEYPLWYETEKENLLEIMSACDGCNISRVSHIGSTAVKGLLSKPTVDILLELPSDYELNIVSDLLMKNNWLVMARNDEEKTIDLNKGYAPSGFDVKVFHLHIKPHADWGELYFRDYLQNHPDIAKQYENLKFNLENQFQHNRDAYTEGKTEFVTKYTEKARIEFPGRYIPIA